MAENPWEAPLYDTIHLPKLAGIHPESPSNHLQDKGEGEWAECQHCHAGHSPAQPERGALQAHDHHRLPEPGLFLCHNGLHDYGHWVDPGESHVQGQRASKSHEEPGRGWSQNQTGRWVHSVPGKLTGINHKPSVDVLLRVTVIMLIVESEHELFSTIIQGKEQQHCNVEREVLKLIPWMTLLLKGPI